MFEIKDAESFSSLLQFTGGYLSNALENEIQLVRIDEQGTLLSNMMVQSLKAKFEVVIELYTTDLG